MVNNLNFLYCIEVKDIKIFDNLNYTNLLYLSDCPDKIKTCTLPFNNFVYDKFNTNKEICVEDLLLNVKQKIKAEDKTIMFKNPYLYNLFVINREDFIKFLLDSNDNFDKCYENEIKAHFIGIELKIVLKDCILEEVTDD